MVLILALAAVPSAALRDDGDSASSAMLLNKDLQTAVKSKVHGTKMWGEKCTWRPIGSQCDQDDDLSCRHGTCLRPAGSVRYARQCKHKSECYNSNLPTSSPIC